MAFLLTLIYVALIFLRVEDLFPVISPYSPMLVLGLIASAASSLNVIQTKPFLRRETQLLLGLLAYAIFSDAIGGWFGGSIDALRRFSPCIFAFFLIVTNVKTLRQL